MACLGKRITQHIERNRDDYGMIYDSVNPEIEHDNIMRCPQKITSQRLLGSTSLNIDIAYYLKCKESYNVFLISYYTSFFTDTGRLNPQLAE